MEPSTISDMAATVKSREIQRAMLAEMAGDGSAAVRHFLAAAHLELVLAEDYAAAGLEDMALRSRISAASCLWRAGDEPRARSLLHQLEQSLPAQAAAIRDVIADLSQHHTAQAS
jgi:hypothetical protein